MRRTLGLMLALGLTAAACNGSDDGAAAEECTPQQASAEDPCFYGGRAVLKGGEGSVLLTIEIAETPEQRSRGLMGRESLAEDSGMVFVFFEETSSGFWMKDTLIPLSIAFFDRSGTIVDILDMEPCRSEPCEVYTPDSPYWGALEVSRGMFADWAVSEGDDISVVHNERDKLFGLAS
jgi:uncharacterized membrane protein (UPF0127 family)